MTRLLITLALLLAFTGPVRAQAVLIAHWEGQTLIVSASPGSLYLVGGGRDPQWIGEGYVELPAYGVDSNRAPQLRDAIVLRSGDGAVAASLPVPKRAWVVILPIVVK